MKEEMLTITTYNQRGNESDQVRSLVSQYRCCITRTISEGNSRQYIQKLIQLRNYSVWLHANIFKNMFNSTLQRSI
jgi:hypothetical protein